MKKTGKTPPQPRNGRRPEGVLARVDSPADLKALSPEELAVLAHECRDTIVATITKTGGHLASNLGVVELTLAIHRAFDSPRDRIVWDTSNQCSIATSAAYPTSKS